jgi:twitching motility protein PilT
MAHLSADFDEESWKRIIVSVRAEDLTDIWINPGFVSGRQNGKVVRLDEGTEEQTNALIRQFLYHRPDLRQKLKEPMPSIDVTTPVMGMRFRVKITTAQGHLCAAIRVLPGEAPSPESIGLNPEFLDRLIREPNGLVLVTGQTGSGKTTSIAATINRINATLPVKIITIEYPIEFIFRNQVAEITQREVGVDCNSFAVGLEDALRQSPNIIFCGEILEEGSALTALTASETGHLVFATMHTSGVSFSINRLLDLLPSNYPEERARSILSNALLAVIDQRLLPRKDGGLIAAREICVATTAVKTKIRTKTEDSLVDDMRSGRSEGMIDLNTCLNQIRHLVPPEEYNRHFRKLGGR